MHRDIRPVGTVMHTEGPPQPDILDTLDRLMEAMGDCFTCLCGYDNDKAQVRTWVAEQRALSQKESNYDGRR